MRRHGSTTHWWSPGCDLPHAVLPNRSWKGLYLTVNQLLSPRLTSSKLGWVPVKQLPAQHGLARGQVPWLAQVASGSTSPCTQKHTNTHNCSKPAGLVSGRPPSPGDRSVTCLTCASVLTRSQHGKCAILQTGAAGQDCRAAVPAPGPGVPARQEQGTQAVLLGRAAQTLGCFESKFPNPAKLFSKALL